MTNSLGTLFPLLVVLIGLGPAACGGRTPADPPSPGTLLADTLPFLVPTRPPSHEPADLRARVDPEWRAPVDVLGLTFEPGLSRERKTELVMGAGGVEVVGGRPFPDLSMMDGVYLIRIEGDGAISALQRAMQVLNESPDVVAAFALTDF